MTIALAAHADRARAPVDVVEPEPRDLVAPQAKPDQKGQNCQIALANNRADIASRKKIPNLIGFKPLGQPGGFHAMLMGLTQKLEKGATFPVTLTFQNAGALTVDVEILGLGAKGPEC